MLPVLSRDRQPHLPLLPSGNVTITKLAKDVDDLSGSDTKEIFLAIYISLTISYCRTFENEGMVRTVNNVSFRELVVFIFKTFLQRAFSNPRCSQFSSSMLSADSLSVGHGQNLRSIIDESVAAQLKDIHRILDSFRKNDANYAKAFIKHIPVENTSLRSKYELVCDLRNSAMDEHEMEIKRIINMQRDSVQDLLTKIHDTNTESTGSIDFESVSLPIKLEPTDDLNTNSSGNANQQQTVELIEDPNQNSMEDPIKVPIMSIEHPIENRNDEIVTNRNDELIQNRNDALVQSRNELQNDLNDNVDVRKRSRMNYQGEKQQLVVRLVSNRDIEQRLADGQSEQRPLKRRRVDVNNIDDPEQQCMERHRDAMHELAEWCTSISLSKIASVFQAHFHRSIRATFNGKIKSLLHHFPEYFEMKYNARNNQWIAVSRLFPNISGLWKYRSDDQFKMVLEDDPVSGHIIGFMVLNDKRQYAIEGDRDKDITHMHRGKVSYGFTKLHPDGKRVHYSVALDPGANTMSIIRNGSSKAKTAQLVSKEIPSQFQEELVCAL